MTARWTRTSRPWRSPWSPVNDAPVAANDNYATNEDTALTVAAPGVLANDTDIDSPTLTAVVVAAPAHGTLALAPNGGFTYTPAANYSGADSFTYKANDGTLNSNLATVAISVVAVNQAPVAANQTITHRRGYGGPHRPRRDRSRRLTAHLHDRRSPGARHPERRRADRDLHAGGQLQRPRQLHLQGQRRRAGLERRDGVDTVTAVNDAPVANNQAVTTDEDTAKAITLSATDVEGYAADLRDRRRRRPTAR